MHQFLKFILFWNNTLHVLDGLSVHHQEFKTVHTASSQQYLYDIYLLLYVQSRTPGDGRTDHPKRVVLSQNKFEELVQLVVLL